MRFGICRGRYGGEPYQDSCQTGSGLQGYSYPLQDECTVPCARREDGVCDIPYRVYGGTNFYARKEIKDVLAYLKVINNSTDNLYFRRVVNVPKRGIGEAILSKVESFADAYGLSMMDAAARADEIPGMGWPRPRPRSGSLRSLSHHSGICWRMVRALTRCTTGSLRNTGYESELIAEHTEEAMTRLENIE